MDEVWLCGPQHLPCQASPAACSGGCLPRCITGVPASWSQLHDARGGRSRFFEPSAVLAPNQPQARGPAKAPRPQIWTPLQRWARWSSPPWRTAAGGHHVVSPARPGGPSRPERKRGTACPAPGHYHTADLPRRDSTARRPGDSTSLLTAPRPVPTTRRATLLQSTAEMENTHRMTPPPPRALPLVPRPSLTSTRSPPARSEPTGRAARTQRSADGGRESATPPTETLSTRLVLPDSPRGKRVRLQAGQRGTPI